GVRGDRRDRPHGRRRADTGLPPGPHADRGRGGEHPALHEEGRAGVPQDPGSRLINARPTALYRRIAGRLPACAVMACTLCPSAPAGAAYPERPVRIVVGFLPGSSNDMLARYAGSKLAERYHRQFVVENRPGANGIIAGDLTARATPDGHTLLLVSTSHTMNAGVYKLPFDPVKSFTPVAMLGTGPLVLVVNPAFPATSVKSLIEIAGAKPNAVSYASAGSGGINHFGGALFSRMTGTQLVHVPYKGGAPAHVR